MYLDIKAYIEIEYMPSIWLWLSFRFLVHLVSWTNGVVGTVECAFGWGGQVVGAGRVVADTNVACDTAQPTDDKHSTAL